MNKEEYSQPELTIAAKLHDKLMKAFGATSRAWFTLKSRTAIKARDEITKRWPKDDVILRGWKDAQVVYMTRVNNRSGRSTGLGTMLRMHTRPEFFTAEIINYNNNPLSDLT